MRCSAFATSGPGATGNAAAGTGSAAGVVQTAARDNAAVAPTAINRHDEPHDTDSLTARERERAPRCRRPPDTGLPGPWRLVVGNHAPTRIAGREEQTRTDAASMTLVIRSAPPLLVTHGPVAEVPDGPVNVINVSVEHTLYRPLDVRTEIVPLAQALAAGWIPPGLTTAEPVRPARRAGG